MAMHSGTTARGRAGWALGRRAVAIPARWNRRRDVGDWPARCLGQCRTAGIGPAPSGTSPLTAWSVTNTTQSGRPMASSWDCTLADQARQRIVRRLAGRRAVTLNPRQSVRAARRIRMGRSPTHWLQHRDDSVRRTSSRRRRRSWSGPVTADHSHHTRLGRIVRRPSWQRVRDRRVGVVLRRTRAWHRPVGRTAVGTPRVHRRQRADAALVARDAGWPRTSDGRAARARRRSRRPSSCWRGRGTSRRRPSPKVGHRAARRCQSARKGSSTSALVIQARTSVAARMPTRAPLPSSAVEDPGQQRREAASATGRSSTSGRRSTARVPTRRGHHRPRAAAAGRDDERAHRASGSTVEPAGKRGRVRQGEEATPAPPGHLSPRASVPH